MMTSRLKTFRVRLTNGAYFDCKAHFLTRDATNVFFWLKPHWYSRRLCVAVLDWSTVYAVSAFDEVSSADIAKELGVKL